MIGSMVDVSDYVPHLKWTPIFEWCMVGCEFLYENQKTCECSKRSGYVLTIIKYKLQNSYKIICLFKP